MNKSEMCVWSVLTKVPYSAGDPPPRVWEPLFMVVAPSAERAARMVTEAYLVTVVAVKRRDNHGVLIDPDFVARLARPTRKTARAK